jgi:hypothetical protein
MTDERLARLLDETLAMAPARAPEGLLASVLDGIAATGQRRSLALWPAQPAVLGWPSFRVASAFLAGVIVAAIGFSLFMLAPSGPGQPASPGPSPSPSPTPSPTASPRLFEGEIDLSEPAAMVDQTTIADRWLTSASFGLPIHFRVTAAAVPVSSGEPRPSLWCPASVEPGVIVLPDTKACLRNVRFMVPDAVSCGSEPRSAAALQAALLANETLGARDGGAIAENPALPENLFAPGVDGRLIMIDTPRAFDDTADDPDGCVIRNGATEIEIRGDVPQALLLLEVRGQLVVIRMAGAQDRLSGAEANERGYLGAIDLQIFLSRIQDITFD